MPTHPTLLSLSLPIQADVRGIICNAGKQRATGTPTIRGNEPREKHWLRARWAEHQTGRLVPSVDTLTYSLAWTADARITAAAGGHRAHSGLEDARCGAMYRPTSIFARPLISPSMRHAHQPVKQARRVRNAHGSEDVAQELRGAAEYAAMRRVEGPCAAAHEALARSARGVARVAAAGSTGRGEHDDILAAFQTRLTLAILLQMLPAAPRELEHVSHVELSQTPPSHPAHKYTTCIDAVELGRRIRIASSHEHSADGSSANDAAAR